MSSGRMQAGGLEYFPCSYGGSTTLFRGPRRPVEGDYFAFIGGAETFGRFLPQPYPAILEEDMKIPSVNLGLAGAGVDVFLSDPDLLALAGQARAVVIRLMAAQNLTNRFYSVHPRHNDVFLQASGALLSLYPEVDFTLFDHVMPLLEHLRSLSPDRFVAIRQELQAAWVQRMGMLMAEIRAPVVLLWFAEFPPATEPSAAVHDPLFVTRGMVAAIAPGAVACVECVPSIESLAEGTEGMIFADGDVALAEQAMSWAAHCEVARMLRPTLAGVLRPRLMLH